MPVILSTSWSLVVTSYNLALKSYEQIAILFLLPSLIYILSINFIGPNFNPIRTTLSSHQFIGVYLLIVWAIVSLINFSASTYFRVITAKTAKAPSLVECYREGSKIMIKVLTVQMLSILVIGLGFMALIVPGVIFFRRYWFCSFYTISHPNLTIREIFNKAANETKPFANYLYATASLILLINLTIGILIGGSPIGDVFVFLIGYSILFVPSLRYQEITSYKIKKQTTKKII